jgi:hypothetical protein
MSQAFTAVDAHSVRVPSGWWQRVLMWTVALLFQFPRFFGSVVPVFNAFVRKRMPDSAAEAFHHFTSVLPAERSFIISRS